MKRWLPLLIVVMVTSRGNADEPAFPRGLGFRTLGQPETAVQVRKDLWYVRQGVEDTTFKAELKVKLDALLATAERALNSAKGPEEAAIIRDRTEREAATFLTVEQREELGRRTTIAFVELLMLNSGFSAHDIDADVVAAFGLTAEQTRKIRGLLDGVHPNAAANPVNPIAPAEARRAVRAVLSAKQREILDEKIEAGLKAAGAKVPATRKSEASR